MNNGYQQIVGVVKSVIKLCIYSYNHYLKNINFTLEHLKMINT